MKLFSNTVNKKSFKKSSKTNEYNKFINRINKFKKFKQNSKDYESIHLYRDEMFYEFFKKITQDNFSYEEIVKISKILYKIPDDNMWYA